MVAGRVLPADLPLVSHGDYAPRNILVGAHGEVTVLDTLGRWRAPIGSDLGNFLFAIKAGRAQMSSWLGVCAIGNRQVGRRVSARLLRRGAHAAHGRAALEIRTLLDSGHRWCAGIERPAAGAG